MNDTEGPRRSDRRQPAQLDEAELDSIKDTLDDQAAQRKAAHVNTLRIIVDGRERARFDLNETRRTSFQLADDDELIEVRSCTTNGAELLLATHLVAHARVGHEAQTARAAITLEGGQQISFRITPAANDGGATVEITYHETAPLSVVAHALGRLAHGGGYRTRGRARKVLAPALALVVLAVCLGVVIKYAHHSDAGAPQPESQATSVQQNGAANEANTRAAQGTVTDDTSSAGAPATVSTSNAAAGRKPPSANAPDKRSNVAPTPEVVGTHQQRAPESAARNPTQESSAVTTLPETAVENDTRTRGGANEPAAVSLSAVRSVYVETLGAESASQRVRQLLGENLRASNRLNLAATRAEADALLKVSITRSADTPETFIVRVQLINARGEVIWTGANSAGKYQGTAPSVSANIVRDLLAAVKQ
jgi:hypothetical protein